MNTITDTSNIKSKNYRTRRVVSNESILETLNELNEMINNQLNNQNNQNDKKTIKFLKSSIKIVKQLQGDINRLSSKKNNKRPGTSNSGFTKEANITNELADFLDLNHNIEISRAQITKKIHSYIILNSLQNPLNRREINADTALTKLLRYDSKPIEEGGHGILYYYTIQKLIQQHINKGRA